MCLSDIKWLLLEKEPYFSAISRTMRTAALEASGDRPGMAGILAAANEGIAKTYTTKTNHPNTSSVARHAMSTILLALPCARAKKPTHKPKNENIISAPAQRAALHRNGILDSFKAGCHDIHEV